MAIVFRLFGESDTAIQLLQITGDAIACVFIFLIAADLLGARIGLIAGLLAALSPQFTWNSILLLPDSLSVLPLLLAIYLLVRAREHRGLLLPFLAGLLIGTSCLLRPNNLLLAPLISLLIATGLLAVQKHEQKRRQLFAAAALLAGAILVVAPITIRNALVFDHFIPISLGAGQTLLEGIADYDPGRRFGLPDTDVEIAEMEAREYQRPDYASTLFGPDGVTRERLRLKRGVNVIKSNPVWFTGIMFQRAIAMLRFERVPIIDAERAGKTGYPSLLRFVQKVFLTATMLPLSIIGFVALLLTRRWTALAALLVVPTYYFLFQSALHTEYRYIIALHYFLLVFASVAIYLVGRTIAVRLFRKS
jgi:4-amino-4-deoxy-L-arabinose transferase-like glycosyltransferase